MSRGAQGGYWRTSHSYGASPNVGHTALKEWLTLAAEHHLDSKGLWITPPGRTLLVALSQVGLNGSGDFGGTWTDYGPVENIKEILEGSGTENLHPGRSYEAVACVVRDEAAAHLEIVPKLSDDLSINDAVRFVVGAVALIRPEQRIPL
jgi:hypothetical protein